MHKRSKSIFFGGCAALLLAGCSSSGGLFGGNPLTTQSISTSPTGASTVAAVPKVDPACYSIAQRIEMLRKDGLTDRLEKASAGKSSTVAVKRTSLAQAAELDRANAEFQAKCSAFGPRPAQTAAQVAPAGNTSQVVSATAPSGHIAPPVVQQR
jgi:hypothetical protein